MEIEDNAKKATENQARFISIYKELIKREGADSLLEFLKRTDFFTAPASTKYHLACVGGLCEHSLNVFTRMKLLVEQEEQMHPEMAGKISKESIAICGLLHDLCKVNFYKIDYRNVKNDYGQWEKVPYYVIEDRMPYGHGEKSVYIIEKYIRLTIDEAMAINWHMGGFDKRVVGGDHAISDAFETYPMAVLLHSADFITSYLDEVRD